MANVKYDNLVPLLASGNLIWPTDRIQGVLLQGAVFNKTHKRLSEVTGTIRSRSPLPERTVDPTDGAFLGFPTSFEGALANVNYAVIVAKEDGTNDPLLISFYDTDAGAQPILIAVNGTLTVRPLGATPTTPGVWVDFS